MGFVKLRLNKAGVFLLKGVYAECRRLRYSFLMSPEATE
jgi:hypothetical protein